MKTACLIGANSNLGRRLRLLMAKEYFIIGHYGRRQSDLTDEHAVMTFADSLPALDVLICCTGRKITAGAFDELSFFREMIDINLIVPFLCCKYIATKVRQGGHIFTIGSADGCFAQEDGLMYASSKAALHTYTKGLAKTLVGKVSVNCIAPGTFWDSLVIDKIAETILSLCGTSYLNGQVIRVDGGHHTFSC